MRYIQLLLLFVFWGQAQNHNIQNISFLNTKKMNISFLESLLTTKKGEAVDSLKLKNDREFLNRLNGISKITYEIKYQEDSCDILFHIEENKSIIPSAAVWSAIDAVAFRIGLYDYNFTGNNSTLGGYYQYNYFHSGGISYQAPFLFSNTFGIEANLQSRSSKEPVFLTNGSANYKYTNSSAELLGVYQLNFKHRFKLGASFFNEKYTYLEGATATSIPLSLDIDKVLIKLEHSFNDIEYDYYLLDGAKNNVFVQIVNEPDFKQNNFFIAWNDICLYLPSGYKGNWASRVRVGFSTNKRTPFAPFAVDNNINIRGVGNIIDRGTGAIVLNTEYRKTFFEKNWFVLQGNIFIDGGTWRKPGGTIDNLYNTNNIRVFSGAGLRFIHKTIYNAVLRVDYGFGLTPNDGHGLVFGIGQYF